jgi:hypothetical protein
MENDEKEKTRLLQLFAEKYDSSYRKPLSKGGKRITKPQLCGCVVIDVEEITMRHKRTVEGKTQRKKWRYLF